MTDQHHILINFLPGSGGHLLGWLLRQCLEPTLEPVSLDSLAQSHGSCHGYKSYTGSVIRDHLSAVRAGYWDRDQGWDTPLPQSLLSRGQGITAQGRWPDLSALFRDRDRLRVLPLHHPYAESDIPHWVRPLRIVLESDLDLELSHCLYYYKIRHRRSGSSWCGPQQRLDQYERYLVQIERDWAQYTTGQLSPETQQVFPVFCLRRDLARTGLGPRTSLFSFRDLVALTDGRAQRDLLAQWFQTQLDLVISGPALDSAVLSWQRWQQANHSWLLELEPQLWQRWQQDL